MSTDNSNDDPRIKRTSGGSIQFSHALAPAAEEVSTAPTHRVNEGTVRYTMGQANAETTGRAVYQHGAEAPQPVTSIAGTVYRSTFGRAQDMVRLPDGTETSAKAAEAMGLLRREGDKWVDVGGSMEQLTAETDALPEVQSGEAFDPEDLAAWSEDVAPLEQFVYDGTMASTIAAVTTDGNIDKAVRQLTEQGQMDPSLAREYVTEGIGLHERACDKVLLPFLGTADRVAAFRTHLESQPRLFREVIEGLAYGHDTTKLMQEAGTWQRNNAPDLSAWVAAGFETAMSPTGDVLVRRPGGNFVRAKDI